MSEIYTQKQIEYLRTILKTVVNEPRIEFESDYEPNDMLEIQDELFIFYSNGYYYTGHLIHTPGTWSEPPDTDIIDRGKYHHFHQAVRDVAIHLATTRIDEAIEIASQP